MKWNLSEKGNAKAHGFFLRTAVSKNIRTCAATWAKKIAHVLDHAEHRHVNALEHCNAPARVNQREVLRRGNDDCTFQWHLLRNCELCVAGAGRHVDDHEVKLAPLHFSQHLRDRRHHHRSAPNHWRFFIDQKSNRHDGESITFDRLETSAADRLWLFLDGQQFWQRRPINVGVEHADFQPKVPQSEGEIDRRGRLADATFAGGDSDHCVDARDPRLHSVGGMGWARLGLRRRLRRARRTGSAFSSQSNECGFHTGNAAYGLFGRLAHRLPGFHRGGIHRQREEDLAVRHDDIRKHACVRQSHAARRRHLRQSREDLLFTHRHRHSSLFSAPP